MPVKFICPHCETLLRVTRRKIGVSVECPTCGDPCVVPEQRAAAAGVARKKVAHRRKDVIADEPSGDALAAFESLDRLLPPAHSSPHAARAPAAASTQRRNGSRQTQAVGSAPANRISESPRLENFAGSSLSSSGRKPVAAGELVVISRRAVYLQAACIPLLLMIGMAVGYFLGRSHSAVPATSTEITAPLPADSEERKRMDEWLFKDAA